MASLNQTAHFSRIAIKWGAIALVVMIVGRFAFGVLGSVYSALFPEEPAPPTVGFGIIPKIDFPESAFTDLEYQLETATGTIPPFPDRLEVFEYILQRPNLLAVDRAIDEADRLGFEDEPEELSSTTFLWTKNDDIPATLTTNVFDGTFVLEYDWNKAADFLLNKQLVSEEVGSGRVEDFLQSPQLWPADMVGAPYTVTYLKASGRAYQDAVSLSEADFLEFNFFRNPVNELYPVVTVDGETGVVKAILSTNPSRAWLVYLEYNYFPINYERIETYPLKTGEQAWIELQEGRGYIASLEEGVDEVVIRQMELGYYDAFDKQPYMQPVYIFRGDNEFVGYVQAVRDPTLSPTPVVE